MRERKRERERERERESARAPTREPPGSKALENEANDMDQWIV